MSFLKEHYLSDIRGELQKQFGFKNIFQIPKLYKIVVNVGAGEAVQNQNVLENIVGDLALVTGQKPVLRKAKKSIAGFKLREGMPIGVMVTLRGEKMYDFLYRLINIAIPRIRDFQGLSPKAFDSNGNLTFGVKEQLIFTEINYNSVDRIRGLGITFVINSKNKAYSKFLLEKFGIPFQSK